MAKTPSKKSAKAPKKAGNKKKTNKRTESYSSYIYKVLKQVHPDTGNSKRGMCHGGSLVTQGQPNDGTLYGRELEIPTIQDTIAGFPRTFLRKANQKDIPFPFDWPVLYDDVTKDPFRVPASPLKIPFGLTSKTEPKTDDQTKVSS